MQKATTYGMYSSDPRRRRGFTLTEMAIVLGIVGLILGAIWVAASAVYNNLRVSKANTELLTIVQNVRSMYANTATVDPAANMPARFAATKAGDANDTYISSGTFPVDMLDTGVTNTATFVYGPWGQSGINRGSVGIIAATTATTNDSFEVIFDNVPQSACVSLLTSVTGTGRDNGMTLAGAGVLAAYPALIAPTNAVPITAGAAAAACNRNSSAVGFVFRLKG